LTAILACPLHVSVEQVEDFCAESCGVAHAVLLPSARAGICWALQAAVSSETRVIGPAYTCHAVHEAIARVGGQMHLVDVNSETFLMDQAAVASATRGHSYAIVLSEIYGHPYNAEMLKTGPAVPPLLRVFDAAMTVPDPMVFDRLDKSDFAVTSFGIGKCVYAGWGGAGLTWDRNLAKEVRRRRDAKLDKPSLMLALKRGAEIVLRTLAHSRPLYASVQKFRRRPDHLATFPQEWFTDHDFSKEWRAPSSRLDRGLVCRNVANATQLSALRRALADRYHNNLSGMPNVALPPASTLAMSHYTIQVPDQSRQLMRSSLERYGIDTGRLFRFPGYLSRGDYPATAKLSQQVINLPIDAMLSVRRVDYISECVRKCAAVTIDGPLPVQSGSDTGRGARSIASGDASRFAISGAPHALDPAIHIRTDAADGDF
jgi:dTDP-4-amino-4,6-dideoxygalactose transaminase